LNSFLEAELRVLQVELVKHQRFAPDCVSAERLAL
jgi:hypothetical protein